MGSLHQSSQFVRWNEGDIWRTPPSDDHDLMIVTNLVQNGSQIVAQASIGSLDRHPI
jgi:hypothetical protein